MAGADGVFQSVAIGAQGEGCEQFADMNDTYRTGLITTTDIPSAIGGEAYGELNDRHTPAFDALVWSARADADVTVCERGGLERAFLARCVQGAQTSDYEYRADGLRIRVPIGGAEPSPTRKVRAGLLGALFDHW